MFAYSGAVYASFMQFNSLDKDRSKSFPHSCVSIHCQGYETSLAECVIYDKVRIGGRKVATVTCYEESRAPKGQNILIILLFSVGSIFEYISCKLTSNGRRGCVFRSVQPPTEVSNPQRLCFFRSFSSLPSTVFLQTGQYC